MIKQDLLITAFLIFSIFGIFVAGAWATPSLWVIETIDSNGDTGGDTSIAVDESDYVHISYYDDSNGDLKYATNIYDSWESETVDSEGDIGRDTSIDIDQSGHIHISYIDWSNKSLKYATNASGEWVATSIDLIGWVCSQTSIAVDASNHAHISYYGSNRNLKYATNSSGNWITQTVDNNEGAGYYSSIAVDFSDNLHISYFNVELGKLWYATNKSGTWVTELVDDRPSAGFHTSIVVDLLGKAHISYEYWYDSDLQYATNASGTWITEIVDYNGAVGGYSSIALDQSEYVHISYKDWSNKNLKYANNASGSWITETVDNNGNVGQYSSIAVDHSGYIHISYYDITNEDLKYATNKPKAGVVLLFDTSGSMSWRHDGTRPAPPEEQRIAFSKEATYPFLEMLNDFNSQKGNFGIANFPPHPWNSSVGCNGQVLTAMTSITEDSKNTAISNTIPGIVAEGNTPLLAGMSTAVGMFGSEANRAIVLLSDGYHNCPSYVDIGNPEVTDIISQLNAESIKVFAIGFGRPIDIDHPLLNALATETGGQFYDVTTSDFDPTSWNPATDLQTAYKAILVDALDLETATDPMGIIEADEKIVRQVRLNEHDRRVCFFLSWATPAEARLGFKVISSDNQVVPITDSTSGVYFHEGKTYKIITVDMSFLEMPGKVGPTPWEIEIDATKLDSGECEYYQYSVILDSHLKMKVAFDKISYGTGDTIVVAAKITEAGQPIADLTDVHVKVSKPKDGVGNWFAANKISVEELKQIPERCGNENLSPLHRKALFLSDIRKVMFISRTDSVTLPLYDDGTHGDASVGDGIYTNQFNNAITEGTYSFHFSATGSTNGGNSFERDDLIQKYITVNPAPEAFYVDVIRLPFVKENKLKQFEIIVMPKDTLGNYLGPRYSKLINMTNSHGKFINILQDNLDGTYNRILQLPTTVDIEDVTITTNAKGETFSFNLADKLENPYSFSLHVGSTIPFENIRNDYDPDYSIALNFGYHFTQQFSAIGLVEYNHLKAGEPSVRDTYWCNISANFKNKLVKLSLCPFINGGPGIYIPENGSVKAGFNVGVGLDCSLTPDWIIELGADYHHVFTNGNDVDFCVQHISLIYRF